MDNKTKTAPKWGTLEWVMAYPHSKMDRKRRRRAEAVVDQEELKALKSAPHTCCLDAAIRRVAVRYKVILGTKSDVQKFEKALQTLASYESAIYDAAFADLLIRAWKLDTGDKLTLDGRKGFCK